MLTSSLLHCTNKMWPVTIIISKDFCSSVWSGVWPLFKSVPEALKKKKELYLQLNAFLCVLSSLLDYANYSSNPFCP